MPIIDSPMYTRPPRDTQRASVDQTFQELVAEGNQLKGSMYDTPRHKVARFIDPGQPSLTDFVPQVGIVANPSHMAFQRLKQLDPGLSRAAEVMKPTTEWLSKQAGSFAPNVFGKTTGMKPSRMEDAAAHVRRGLGAGGLTPDEFKRLVGYNQGQLGSTMQMVSPRTGTDATIIHEMLHALYGPKDAVKMQARLNNDRGRELLQTALNRTSLPPERKMAIASQYWDDPAHGLIEATAQFKIDKAARGGMAVTR